MKLWEGAKINPKARSGNWYRESGLGMGLTLEMAARLNAYVLVDRGTWLANTNRKRMEVLVEGDPRLFNQYEIVVVNASRHANVNLAGATLLTDWLASDEGQALIASFKLDDKQVFFPNARGTN
jgi:tungstate transport system substrate-binding protein